MVLYVPGAPQTMGMNLVIEYNHLFLCKFSRNNLIWSYKLFFSHDSSKVFPSDVCIFIFFTETPIYWKTKWTEFKVLSCKRQAFSSFSLLFLLTVTLFCFSQQPFKFLLRIFHIIIWSRKSCLTIIWGTSLDIREDFQSISILFIFFSSVKEKYETTLHSI